MRSRELAPIFSMPSAMLFISSMLAEGIFAFIVIIFLTSLLLPHLQRHAGGLLVAFMQRYLQKKFP